MPPELHPRLKRQLAEAGIDPAQTPDPEAWSTLLESVSAAFDDVDERLFGGMEMLRPQPTPTSDGPNPHAQFISNMSHELRTPLNAILGYSQMLLEEADDEALRDDVRKIDGAGRRLLGLINDILDLSRIDAGRLRLERTPIDLQELLETAIEKLGTRATAQDNALVLGPVPHMAPVMADRNRLLQCVTNVLSNAIKFTRGGRITVTVTQTGSWVDIDVTDTGIGMSLEHQAMVFGDFSQVDATERRHFGGTGLGLALTRRMTELMGGMVLLRSELGVGSTFVIRLPHHARTPATPLRADELPAHLGPHDRVLVLIDDDPDVQDLAQRILEREGWVVLAAPDAASGLELVRHTEPQVVLLDLLLPGPSGWDVLELLKEDPATRDIPVIILSTTDERERGQQAGAVAYLVKPVGRDQLVAALDVHA